MTDPLSAEQRTRFDAINRDLSRTVTVFLTPADFRALWIMVKEHDRLARVLEIERLQWRRHLPCPDCRDKVTEGECERCGRQQAESALTALRAEVAHLQEWKESALQALASWHALSDALLPFAPAALGTYLPDHLRTAIPAALTALRADHARLRALPRFQLHVHVGRLEPIIRPFDDDPNKCGAFIRGIDLDEALAGAPEEAGAVKCCSGEPITDGGLPSDGPIYPGDPAHCPACAASAEPTKEPR